MIRIIVTFANQIFDCRSQKYEQAFKKYDFVKNDINGESRFHQKPTFFLAFFIVFEWSRILESAMDKQEVKCNAKLSRN